MRKLFKKNNNSLSRSKTTFSAGFTALEMLFVIAIFGILTTITIANYGNFNKNIILTNLAHEVALQIREAQVFSLGVRSISGITGTDLGIRGEFNTRYGVYFNLSESGGSDEKFVSFADFLPQSNEPNIVSGDGVCTDAGEPCLISSCFIDPEGSSNNECLKVATLAKGITFDRFCMSPDSVDSPVNLEDGTCSNSDYEIETLYITFVRPYTDAIIKENVNTEYGQNAGIVLKSSAGSKRAVIVRSSGQISVEVIGAQNHSIGE